MAIIVGSGEYRYEVIENWGKLPDGWHYGDVAAVGVDSKDNVYVFTRGEHPMIVFDRDGNFLRSWGEGAVQAPARRAHRAGRTIYCTDDGDHTVRRMTLEGKVLLKIGVPGEPAPYMSGDPFNRCTHTALSPDGDIYVSDGYGNARVHKYSPDGKLQFSWGEPGTDPGAVQYRAQHLLRRGRLGLRRRSREPSRAGVRRQGQVPRAVEQHAPALRTLHDARTQSAGLYRRERTGHGGEREVARHRPARQHRDARGQTARALGDATRERASQFIAPHGVAIDSRGDIYVGEVSRTAMRNRGTPITPEQDIRCMQKLVKLA